jgi:tRNA nucleotidyltransferase (CCA-adding enzyme)
MEKLDIPSDVNYIISTLHGAGYQAFAVGGCVRDAVMGTVPHDWDVTTNARPDDIERVFCDTKKAGYGKDHGTVVLIPDHECVEVTTYRIDGNYTDGRHPDTVTFTDDVKLDLSRRDFTMNAMIYDPATGIYDEFSGREDIKNRIIRAVGDPDRRFTEDALRIMRAMRFESTLGFACEPLTCTSIHENAHLLSLVSQERKTEEFLKLLCGKDVMRVLDSYRDVIGLLFPDIIPCIGFDQKSKYHIYDVWEHIIHSVSAAPQDPEIRMALFLHDIGKPSCATFDERGGHFYGHGETGAEMSRKILDGMKLPRNFCDAVYMLVKYHDYPLDASEKTVRRRLARFGESFLRKLCTVQRADAAGHGTKTDAVFEKIDATQAMIDKIVALNACFSLRDLAINGNDLYAMGVQKGPQMKYLLNKALSAVVDDDVKNDRQELEKYVRSIIDKQPI